MWRERLSDDEKMSVRCERLGKEWIGATAFDGVVDRRYLGLRKAKSRSRLGKVKVRQIAVWGRGQRQRCRSRAARDVSQACHTLLCREVEALIRRCFRLKVL